jgi:hypothetical protein
MSCCIFRKTGGADEKAPAVKMEFDEVSLVVLEFSDNKA